ncbi:MAG: VWA domain-containing protein, partial [Acidobacteria bacterium]|nr:VWA domain-containing protein [Acidobacteriota bacterium]
MLMVDGSWLMGSSLERSPRLPARWLRRAAGVVLTVAVVLGPGSTTEALAELQDGPQPPTANGFGESLDVRWVLVPVLVRSPKGYVEDLEKKDFRLFVDGKRVPIASFETGTDAPVSVVYLQDLSGSMANGGKLETSRRLFHSFLDRSKPSDEYTVATFGNGQIEVQVPRTSDFFLLRRSSPKWQPRGTTALHDAVAWLPDLGTQSLNAKRVAILVTDGADNASTLSGEQARDLVRQAELPVYVLGMAAASVPGKVAEIHEQQRLLAVLRLLAFQTGGRYASVTPADDLKSLSQ